ncbi:hypothetical protein [Reyranella sp.]|uniref:hypothetical protein n=1 Tax=Reyranella sp. TaxID=1929291 RepID=UPI003D0B0689
MTTAEIRPDTFVPVELIRWARDGKVQVKYRRKIGRYAVWGMYFAVPVMKLIHAEGRPALAKKLAELPR